MGKSYLLGYSYLCLEAMTKKNCILGFGTIEVISKILIKVNGRRICNIPIEINEKRIRPLIKQHHKR